MTVPHDPTPVNDDAYCDGGSSPPIAHLRTLFGHVETGYLCLAFGPDYEHLTHRFVDLADKAGRWQAAAKYIALSIKDENCYYSGAVYRDKDAGRTKTNILFVAALLLDRDDHDRHTSLPEPTMTVRTSPGSYQDIYALAGACDVATADRLQAAMCSLCGANHVADAGHLCRLPGSRNFKHDDAPLVTAVDCGDYLRLAAFSHLPMPEMPVEASQRPATGCGGNADILVHTALANAPTRGRRNAGFELAQQLRDDGYEETDAMRIGRDEYVPNVRPVDNEGKVRPYPVAEYVKSCHSAFSRPPRAPYLPPALSPDATGSWGIDDLAALPKIEYLVDGLIIAEGFHTSIGAGGSYKTFVELDLAFHLACDCETWRGYRLAKGVTTLYVAAEGRGGILKRARAWERAHGRTIPNDRFRVYNGEVRLPDAACEAALIAEARHVGATFAVFDTLNRIMVGDENSAKDMGAFLQSCKRIQSAGIAVSVLHHMGWENTRQRGSTALLFASDTERTLTRDESTGVVTMELTRTKEGEPGAKLHFQPRVVPLGTDNDGRPVTSIVLDNADMVKVAFHTMSRYQDLLDCLETFGENGTTSTKWREKSKTPKTTFDRARRYLSGTKEIVREGSLYKVNRESSTTSTT